MGTWIADVFVNSSVGRITTEVEAATFEGARQQIYAKHGNVQTISNLRQVRDKTGKTSTFTSEGEAWSSLISGAAQLALLISTLVAKLLIFLFNHTSRSYNENSTARHPHLKQLSTMLHDSLLNKVGIDEYNELSKINVSFSRVRFACLYCGFAGVDDYIIENYAGFLIRFASFVLALVSPYCFIFVLLFWVLSLATLSYRVRLFNDYRIYHAFLRQACFY